jgi:hypothetical protein
MDKLILKQFTGNLKIKYKNVLQSLKLTYNTDEEQPFIYLDLIKIKKQQQCLGWGSTVLSDIINLADKEQLEIRLYATNIYGSELKRLYEFYLKHGFILNNDDNNYKDSKFIYKPKTNRKRKTKLIEKTLVLL